MKNLCNEATTFDIFQLMRQFEKQTGKQSKHALEIKGSIDFGFPLTEVLSLKPATENQKATLIQTVFSCFGATGSLPESFTELIQERLSNHDSVLSDFCDIFHNHLFQLFYKSWKNAQFSIGFEQNKSDSLHHVLKSISGLNKQSKLKRDDDLYLYYAGLFGKKNRPVSAISQILRQHFNLPISVCNFSGKWMDIDPGETTLLSSRTQKSRHNQLGRDCLIGNKTWLSQHRFDINIGPLTMHEYRTLLPNEKKLNAIRKIAQEFAGEEFTSEIQLTLNQDSIPKCTLSTQKPFRLGWNIWLKSNLNTTAQTHVQFGHPSALISQLTHKENKQ